MRRITRYLIWLFVFTVPWDVVTLSAAGSISRLMGLAMLASAALAMTLEPRFRKPDLIVVLAAVFGMWSGLSLLWTVSYEWTLGRVFTYAQLVVIVWIVQEFTRTREQETSLLVAYCLGCFLPLLSLLNNFRQGVQIGMPGRYSADSVNADDLGLTLALGIPIAWYLLMHRRGIVRIVAITYFIVAPVAILLTGTRGAFLAGAVALMIVPLSLPRQSFRNYSLGALLLVVAGAALVNVVPETSWTRMASIGNEVLEGGTLTGRTVIWQAGIQVFPEHAVLGVGAGAYGPAVAPLLGIAATPHNVPLAVLVEQGLVGFAIFAGILVACARTIWRLRPLERSLWGVLMLTWFVGVLSLSWDTRKATWLLFGLVAAQGTFALAEARSTATRRVAADESASARPLPKQWSRRFPAAR